MIPALGRAVTMAAKLGKGFRETYSTVKAVREVSNQVADVVVGRWGPGGVDPLDSELDAIRQEAANANAGVNQLLSQGIGDNAEVLEFVRMWTGGSHEEPVYPLFGVMLATAEALARQAAEMWSEIDRMCENPELEAAELAEGRLVYAGPIGRWRKDDGEGSRRVVINPAWRSLDVPVELTCREVLGPPTEELPPEGG